MKARILTALVAVFLCLPFAAMAQAPCTDDHAGALAQLEDGYGEVVLMRAAMRDGSVLEITVNPETRTWTALVSQPGGPTCMVAAGDGADFNPPAVPEGPKGTAM